MLEILEDTLIDSVKLLPFLFITYLIMEYLEHKTSNKIENTIKKTGRYGPAIGGIFGILPQCGFSVAATNLYAARLITLGTLISVYLTTSDEMLPVLISQSVPVLTIVKILLIKLLIGILSGFIIDLIIRRNKKEEKQVLEEFCQHENCHCEEGILKSSIRHTINIFVFIFIIVLILNLVIGAIGEDTLSKLISENTILGPVIAGFVGLIPNCASSVIISQLFVKGVINGATLIAGVLVNAGVGLIVLFRVNKHIKQNIQIIGILYAIGVVSGIVLQLIGLKI